MQSYFEGKKELFKELAIEKLEKDWTKYPVLHFSLAGGKHMEKDQLVRYLLYILKVNEEKFGIVNDSPDTNVRMLNLIKTVYEQTGQKVVVLIDEYDAPLLDVVHEDTVFIKLSIRTFGSGESLTMPNFSSFTFNIYKR